MRIEQSYLELDKNGNESLFNIMGVIRNAYKNSFIFQKVML